MGVLDKFLDILKLSDEDEDYDDDFLDDEDDYEEERPKKSFFKKEKKYEDEDDDDDYNYPLETKNKNTRPVTSSSKVTPMRQPARRGGGMEVCVIKPTSVDDSREITETLLSGRTVILNLEGMDYEVAQRIVDFTSGATFAISGNLQKITNHIFLLTPTNVDISGDLEDLLNPSFDTPALKAGY